MEIFDTSVIVALITGACAVIGNALVSRSYRRKEEQQRAIKEAEVEIRLDNIEHKLDIHNGYAEKLGEISVAIAKIQVALEGLINDRRAN